MTRRLFLLVLAAALLPLWVAPTGAQPAVEREIELRVVALSRGYMRPMRATSRRIAAVEGIRSIVALGCSGDTARFKVTTSLADQALADALNLELMGVGTGVVTLAPELGNRARRAEARGVLMQIATALLAQPKPSWRGDSEPLFGQADGLKKKLERLGLSPTLVQGLSYAPDDFHIDESWNESEGSYRIWAGDRWSGVFVRNEYGGNDDVETEQPDKPDPLFVGIRLHRASWRSSMSWVDTESLHLAGHDVSRSDSDASGELLVRKGAGWLQDILRALAALRVREPERKLQDLPSGRGWLIISTLDTSDEGGLNRWDLRHFNIEDFQLSWRDDDGRWIANLKAHHPAHPLYLEAEVDTQSVIDACAKNLTKDERRNLRQADLGDALTWIVAAEEGPEVFKRRRADAAANFDRIREALQKASATHDLAQLCGSLDDAELIKRLGIELAPGGAFAPGDYRIRRQMIGDVEVSVGAPSTGGRYWMLVSAAGGNVIRSNR